MPVLMNSEEFAEECRQRQVDYNKLFEPRVTPQWLRKFEEQVLEECRASLAEISIPAQVEFERRVAIMNAERELLASEERLL